MAHAHQHVRALFGCQWTASFEVGGRPVHDQPMPESSCEMSIAASNKSQVNELPSHAPTLLRFIRAIALQL
jgi:hypothetical protein